MKSSAAGVRMESAGVRWQPCSADDITEVARAHRLSSLPHTYESWLRKHGRGPAGGSTFHRQGGVAYLPDALDNPKIAQEIIEGLSTPFRLPPRALVVSTWQGYMFEFVCCDDGVDPELRTFIEGEPSSGRTHGHRLLSDYLQVLVQTEVTDPG